MTTRPVYLDCNATAPIDPEVAERVIHYLVDDYGNAGSRTHASGVRAKGAVQLARKQVAEAVAARPEEVIFTSGATESNNLAILGLAPFGDRSGRRHIVSSVIEHKAVLQPLEALARRGFEVDLVEPTPGGWVSSEELLGRVREDTLLVSLMHVNNETGVMQPIEEVAAGLSDSAVLFHTDAAQSFGKLVAPLRDPRIDLISISGHKIHAPKGVGALIARRRGFNRAPIEPLMFGGDQERGLRPGTLPVHLIVGLGTAAAVALRDKAARCARYQSIRSDLMDALAPFEATFNGDPARVVPWTINLAIPGVDAEAAMVALKGVVECSNGSACTSHSYEPSHVLVAMRLPPEQLRSALRLSWCHLTDWSGEDARGLASALGSLRQQRIGGQVSR